jgi:UDP-N-acetylglucosamine acyltransferase
MPCIHPTAVVEPGAEIADDVSIGAYSCIGPAVVLEAGVEVASHVVIAGRTRVGAGTSIYPFVSLGQPPQYLAYRGEPTRLEIGRRNIIREHVTMNTGTENGGRVTSIGDDGFFMVGVHIAHDCHIGSQVIMANNATIGGHVSLGDQVVVGGLAAIHQFVRVGSHAMVAGASALGRDVIPFALAVGNRAVLSGLNVVGLRRRGFSRGDIAALRQAYDAIFTGAGGNFAERLAAFLEGRHEGPVEELAAFLRAKGKRPVCLPGDAGEEDAGVE